MVRKYLQLMSNAVISGVLIAIFIAVLWMVVLNGAWWSIQNSFGHSMFHHLEKIVMGATYAQAFSLAIILSIAAGALTVYISRADIKSDKSALQAGAFTGLIIAMTFCIAMNVIMILSMMSSDMTYHDKSAADSIGFSLRYIINYAPMVLFIGLVVPALVTIPAAASGGFIGLRGTACAENRDVEDRRPSNAILIVTAAGVIIVGLMAMLIFLAYNVNPALSLLFSLPFLITLPVLTAAVERPYRIGPVPSAFAVLAISVLAIVLLPMTGVLLACQTGVIYAPPYDWENPVPPDVALYAEESTMQVIQELAGSFGQQRNITWGISQFRFEGNDDYNKAVVEFVNMSIYDVGIIQEDVSLEDTAPDLNQTIIARNSEGVPLVFITRGTLSTNTSEFINYTISADGLAILGKYGFVSV